MKIIITVLLILSGVLPAVAAQGSDTSSLSARQQSLICIAGLTAKGELVTLKPALNAGLESGLTINQVKEAIVHLYAYCGFPRSIRGLQTLMAVLDERKGKGIKDEWGPMASPIDTSGTKYERGKKVLDSLLGAPQNGPATGYAAFSPEIEIFLKEHLFADLFERDVLNYAERELLTISVLSAIGGVEPMLASHLTICMNVGITPSQLQQFVHVIKKTIGSKEAASAQAVLNEVIKSRNK